MNGQKVLSTNQTEAFYHDGFVNDQVCHFVKFFSQPNQKQTIIDLGGGVVFSQLR